MNWPNHADYSDAVQNPELCFDLPELQTGVVATNPLGLPRALSGNFATVYEITGGGETHAVRCFIRQVTNQQARYSALQRYFEPLALPFLVPFEFVEQGIRVSRRMLPIVKMAWVAGAPLHNWIERNISAPEQLAWLAADWRELLRQLKEHRIGHGDLQHGNVLVTDDGDLKLVDYDGIYVPLFARERSPELGHANYQHPRRTPELYDERLDHFSALLIYLSLRALAAEPALWTEYFNGDNLLATAVDLRVPRCSALWPRLLQSPDDDVRRLTVLLTDYLRVAPEQVPDLETVLVERMSAICVPSRLSFDDPEPVQPDFDDGELETSFVTRTRRAPDGPLAAMNIEHNPAGSRPVPPPPRFVDVFGWSALVTALLALAPPLHAVAGISAVILGALAWLVPGRLRQTGRWIAAGSALLGVVCVVHAAGFRAEARRQSLEAAQPLTVATLEHSPMFAEAGPLEPPAEEQPSEEMVSLPDGRELEEQAVPRPLLPPRTRSFVDLVDEWQAHTEPVIGVAISADNRLVIAATKDRFLAFREFASARTVFSRNDLAEPTLALNTLTNVGIVATVDAMHTVHWWSLDGGILLKSLPVNPDSVFLPVVSPDGNDIAVGGRDRRSVAIHFDRSPTVGRTINGLSSWVKFVRHFPQGGSLVVVCHDDSITIADVASGQVRQRMAFPDAAITDVALSPRAAGLLAIGANGRLRGWNVATGQLLGDRSATGRHVVAAMFANDGKQIILAHADGMLELLASTEGFPLLARFDVRHPLASLAVSRDGQLIAAGDGTGKVRVWRLNTTDEPAMRLAQP